MSKLLYETGDDSTGWYAKAIEIDSDIQVIVYDADGDICSDLVKSGISISEAKKYADWIVVSRGIEAIMLAA